MGAATLISAFVFLVFLIHIWVTHSSDSDAAEAVQYLLKDTRLRTGRFRKSRPQGFDDQIRNETLGVSD